MDFGAKIIANVGGVNITQTMMNTWIILIFLTIVALILRAKINNYPLRRQRQMCIRDRLSS